MDITHVHALLSAIYLTEHVPPPGPGDDPAVHAYNAKLAEWRRNVLDAYRVRLANDGL